MNHRVDVVAQETGDVAAVGIWHPLPSDLDRIHRGGPVAVRPSCPRCGSFRTRFLEASTDGLRRRYLCLSVGCFQAGKTFDAEAAAPA